MKICVSGSSGLIGTELCDCFAARGHQVLKLVRSRTMREINCVHWDPYRRALEKEALEGLDAVVHLAGKTLECRWTTRNKQEIISSRVSSTDFLARTLAQLKHPPECLLCASAIGYYGSRGEAVLNEDSPPGDDFLAEVCQKWEAACNPAHDAGLRVVNLRFGLVLSTNGGALRRLLIPYRLGLGGKIGNGEQFVSWVSLADLVSVVEHCLQTKSLQGPINVVSPNPVSNREFAAVLARALGRPNFLSFPDCFVRLIFGEMGQSLLLSSTRVLPTKLLNSGFRFSHEKLGDTFRVLIRGKAAFHKV
jgi:uncharacterized protein